MWGFVRKKYSKTFESEMQLLLDKFSAQIDPEYRRYSSFRESVCKDLSDQKKPILDKSKIEYDNIRKEYGIYGLLDRTISTADYFINDEKLYKERQVDKRYKELEALLDKQASELVDTSFERLMINISGHHRKFNDGVTALKKKYGRSW
jgi:hypothetical protein